MVKIPMLDIFFSFILSIKHIFRLLLNEVEIQHIWLYSSEVSEGPSLPVSAMLGWGRVCRMVANLDQKAKEKY